MVGAVVLTQKDVSGAAASGGIDGVGRWNSSVGLSSWGVDIHAQKRVVLKLRDGSERITNAGGHDTMRAHDPPEPVAVVEVPYEALTPRKDDTANLLVPLCASLSHVAFSTYRLEPQYAVFGQSAGTAAAMAAAGNGVVQAVNITALQAALSSAGQIIRRGRPPPHPHPPAPPPARQLQLKLGPCGTSGAKMHLVNATTSASSVLIQDGQGMCASALGYSTKVGTMLVAAACHPNDKALSHQNQEFRFAATARGMPAERICLASGNTAPGGCRTACVVASTATTGGIIELGACGRGSGSWVYNASAGQIALAGDPNQNTDLCLVG